MADERRQIEKVPAVTQRPLKMQLLCLGLSRTGTMSLESALGKLGYTSYHMTSLIKGEGMKNRHAWCWSEAFEAKFSGKGGFKREQFDKILQNYSAVTDAPAVNFSDELMEAYPEAKVILTSRDATKWLVSIERIYYSIIEWPHMRYAGYLHPPLTVHMGLLKLILRDWAVNDDWSDREAVVAGFHAHNEHIRKTAPADRFLDFRVDQGWEPLCKFLGKPVPNEPFPHVNEGDTIKDMYKGVVYFIYARVFFKYMQLPVLAGLITAGIRLYRGKSLPFGLAAPSFIRRLFN